MTRQTIGNVLRHYGGFGPGFDFLRVVLALSIVIWHATPVATGRHWLDVTPIVWFPGYGMLIMFFALSGFLITGSAQRLCLSNFLINRGLRILPALFIEIVLSAFLLGPVFTDLALSDYFSRSETYAYFTNLVGFMRYSLPGVFQHNPSHLVNWALWTVPFEFVCYIIMSVFIVSGMLRRPRAILAVTAIYMVIGLATSLLNLDTETLAGDLADRLISGRGSKLLIAFALGIAAYLYKDRLKYDWRLFASATALCIGASLIRPAPWLSVPALNVLLCPALVYMTIFIGCTKMPKLPIYGTGDYSYGIYLYGLPIQQMVRATLPFTTSALWNLIFAIPLVTLFAGVCWHAIEKQILRQRKRFSFVARVRGVEGLGESKVDAPPSPK